MPSATQRIERLAEAWNEEEITLAAIHRWVEQFSPEDHGTAIRLLECMELHSWARMIRECRLLHQRLCMDLQEDGFDVERLSDIDFTRAFVGKSGDLACYVYRKANRLSVNHFHTIDALLQGQQDCSGRAIVILDDYIGTGSQFLFQFVARNRDHAALLSRYKRIRLASLVVHDDARVKWRLLQRRAIEEVMAIEEQQLVCVDFSAERIALTEVLAFIDWRKAGLLAVQRDFPVTAHPGLTPEERKAVRFFCSANSVKTLPEPRSFCWATIPFFMAPRMLWLRFCCLCLNAWKISRFTRRSRCVACQQRSSTMTLRILSRSPRFNPFGSWLDWL